MTYSEHPAVEHLDDPNFKIEGCRYIDLADFSTEEAGGLGVIEGPEHTGFPIARVYFIYGVPDGIIRGGHAHRELEQVFVAVSGQFTMELDNGHSQDRVTLSLPTRGLYVPAMTWRELFDFTSDAVCLVLASQHYDASDYIHDHDEFVRTSRWATQSAAP